MRWGALWFVLPTLANIVTGLWCLGVLPREVLLRFMGGDLLSTLSLALGSILGLLALGLMLSAIRSEDPATLVKSAGWALLGTIVTMVLARDGVRQGMFGLAGFSPTTWIDPQWDVIAIFAVLLVAGLAVTIWMVSLLVRTKAA